MPRPLRISLEIIASLVGVVAALALFLIWRLNTGPMQAEFLTPAIEAGIESIVPGTHVTISHTLLAWDDTVHSLAFHTQDLRVVDHNGHGIAAVPKLDVELNALGLLFGQILPTELRVEHPQFQLERQPDGSFTFGGVATGGDAASGDDDDDDDTMKDSLARIAHNLEHALFTRKLQIHRAIFDIHDHATANNWSVSIPDIILERSGRDLSGQAVIEVTQKDRIATVDVHYAYDRGAGEHRLSANFSDITPAFFAGQHPDALGLGPLALADLPFSGNVALAFDSNMNVASGSLQLHGDAGFLRSTTLWDAPRAVKAFDIKADYDRKAKALNIPTATVDFGGPKLSLSATGTPTGRKVDFALLVQLDNWPMDQYGQLWPKTILPDARDWIAANLSKGAFDHAEAAIKGTADMDHPDNVNVTEGKGRVTASGGTVHYADGMPPVEGVNADAVFDLNQLTAQISGGGVGDIRVVPFTLIIDGFERDTQNITIPLKVAGPVPSIMRLIDHPPLGYAKALGLKPEDISGQAEAQVTFSFPLLKELGMDNIAITGNANLKNVASSKLLKGVAITQGNLELALDADGFKINGPATLNAIPLQVAWEQAFKESADRPLKEAVVSGNLSAEQIQSLGTDAFNGTRGTMVATLHMTQPTKTRTLFSGTLDMTAAEVHLDRLHWKKAAQAPAGASFNAEQNGDEDFEIKALELHGPQMNVKGKARLASEDGRLMSLHLDPMIVGHTNALINFSRLDDDKGGALHIDAEGEGLDISGLSDSKQPTNAPPSQPPSQPQTQSPPTEFRINVGKLYTSDVGFIAHADGYAIRDAKGWSEISLHGLADGSEPLGIELIVRKDGGRDFSVACNDFGKALKGLGFADKVRGGKLEVTGASDPADPRAIIGKLDIGSFTAGDLPVLAVLMNAASPFGFKGLFTGSMDFDSVRGKFRWEGDTIDLIGVHAAGAAVGLNINGRADLGGGDTDLHGTMVPFSMVNGVIGSIPIIGDLFTGGKNQGVFAVSYTIKGPIENPKVSVNPASLLTPGILRSLIFGGGDDGDDKKPDNK